MENQILKFINRIKYFSKNKPYPVTKLDYLQNNEASNYDLPCIENKLEELIHNNSIDEKFEITIPIKLSTLPK